MLERGSNTTTVRWPVPDLIPVWAFMLCESSKNLKMENQQSNVDDKGSRLDLRLKLKDKTEIDVEIQSYNHAAFSERVLYYWSKLYMNKLVIRFSLSTWRFT